MRAFDFRKLFIGNIFIYITLLLMFAGGGVLGILFGKNLNIEFIFVFSEEYFLLVFSKESLWTVFLSRLVNNLALIVIFALPAITPYLIPMSYIACLYRGYILGLTMIGICELFGAAGALIIIILIIPTQFSLQFLLITVSVNGLYLCRVRSFRLFIEVVIILYALTIAVAVVEICLIAVLIRPLSFVV